jgi:phosphinothricin acetyltransferase
LRGRIRVATVDDAPRLLEISAKYCHSDGHTAGYETPSLAVFQSRIRATLAFFPCLVIEDASSGRAVGYACGKFWHSSPGPHWIASTAIWIDSEFCGRGLGAKFYEPLIAALTDQRFVEVCAGICLPNDASVRLHQKFGFEPRATLPALTFKKGWHPGQYWEQTLNERKNPPDQVIPFAEVDQVKYIGEV